MWLFSLHVIYRAISVASNAKKAMCNNYLFSEENSSCSSREDKHPGEMRAMIAFLMAERVN